MPTATSIIDALGGTNFVAGALPRPRNGSRRLNPSVVSSWKARGRIPSRNWPGIIGLAKRKRVKGITFEALASLAPPRAVRGNRHRRN